ncbi:MAG: hypothetical protein JXB50_08235 [Spirochaetes bacterium]|nr:hypothetical protein [Spirochaetota bacterium]
MKKSFLLVLLMIFLIILFFIACPVDQEITSDDENSSSSSNNSTGTSSNSSAVTSSTGTSSSVSAVDDMDIWVDVWTMDDKTSGYSMYYAHAHLRRDSDENTPMFNNAVITVNGLTLDFDDSYGENGRFSYEGSGLSLTVGSNVTIIVSHPAITTLNFTMTVPQFVTTLNTSVSIDAFQAQAVPTNLTLSWNSATCDYYVPFIDMIWEDMIWGSGVSTTDTSYLFTPDDIEEDPEEGPPNYIGFEVETYNEIWDNNSNGWYCFTVGSQHIPVISNEPEEVGNIFKSILNSSKSAKLPGFVKKKVKSRVYREKR